MSTLKNSVQLIGNVGQAPTMANHVRGKKAARFSIAIMNTKKTIRAKKLIPLTGIRSQLGARLRGQRKFCKQGKGNCDYGKIRQPHLFDHSCYFHPSWILKPSEADIKLAQKIEKAGELFDIKFLDHLILTSDVDYYSFADSGIL